MKASFSSSGKQISTQYIKLLWHHRKYASFASKQNPDDKFGGGTQKRRKRSDKPTSPGFTFFAGKVKEESFPTQKGGREG